MRIKWRSGYPYKGKRYAVAYKYDDEVLGYMATNDSKRAIYRCNKWPDRFVVDIETGQVIHISTYKRKA